MHILLDCDVCDTVMLCHVTVTCHVSHLPCVTADDNLVKPIGL